jgi:hypothetical protein
MYLFVAYTTWTGQIKRKGGGVGDGYLSPDIFLNLNWKTQTSFQFIIHYLFVAYTTWTGQIKRKGGGLGDGYLSPNIFLNLNWKTQTSFQFIIHCLGKQKCNKICLNIIGFFKVNMPAGFESHEWILTSSGFTFLLIFSFSLLLSEYIHIHTSISTSTTSLTTTTATTSRTKHNWNRSYLCVW